MSKGLYRWCSSAVQSTVEIALLTPLTNLTVFHVVQCTTPVKKSVINFFGLLKYGRLPADFKTLMRSKWKSGELHTLFAGGGTTLAARLISKGLSELLYYLVGSRIQDRRKKTQAFALINGVCSLIVYPLYVVAARLAMTQMIGAGDTLSYNIDPTSITHSLSMIYNNEGLTGLYSGVWYHYCHSALQYLMYQSRYPGFSNGLLHHFNVVFTLTNLEIVAKYNQTGGAANAFRVIQALDAPINCLIWVKGLLGMVCIRTAEWLGTLIENNRIEVYFH